MTLIIQVEIEVDGAVTDRSARQITQNVDTAIALAVDAGRVVDDPDLKLVSVRVWKPAQPLS